TGPTLTVGGELNKLAHNMSAGRDMSGVHWRVADNFTGLTQGEAVAIRLLQEAKATYPEPNASFTLTKFDGTTITI
ncbi:MAG: phosphoesterase, partial [Acidobacteria bacterium]|nr:phosphoesterase [Acidobacteriota bacterium]